MLSPSEVCFIKNLFVIICLTVVKLTSIKVCPNEEKVGLISSFIHQMVASKEKNEYIQIFITQTWLQTWLRYVRVAYMLSQIRLSIVCNVHAPCSGGWNFRQCFYASLCPADLHAKFYRDRPRGTAPSGVKRNTGSQIWLYQGHIKGILLVTKKGTHVIKKIIRILGKLLGYVWRGAKLPPPVQSKIHAYAPARYNHAIAPRC